MNMEIEKTAVRPHYHASADAIGTMVTLRIRSEYIVF